MSEGTDAQPLVSVIIPVYNVEKYLEDCVNSVLKQTYRNLEIVLVDDGSPDKSGEMCDELARKDSRIKVVHKDNEGLNYARKTGFENSTGEYVVFVDSDDALREDAIERMVKVARGKSVDLVIGGYKKFTGSLPEKTNLKQNSRVEVVDQDRAIRGLLLGVEHSNVFMMTAWCKLFSRGLVEGVDWGESNYRSNEDEFMALQYYSSIKTNIAILPDDFYMYRENPDSITRADYKNSFKGEALNRFDTIDRIYQEATQRLGDEYESHILAKFIYEFIIITHKEAVDDSSFDGIRGAYVKYFEPKKKFFTEDVLAHLDPLTRVQYEGLMSGGIIGCLRAKSEYLDRIGVEYRGYLQNLEKSINEKDKIIREQAEVLIKKGRLRKRLAGALRRFER